MTKHESLSDRSRLGRRFSSRIASGRSSRLRLCFVKPYPLMCCASAGTLAWRFAGAGGQFFCFEFKNLAGARFRNKDALRIVSDFA